MYNNFVSIVLVIASVLVSIVYAIPEYRSMGESRERAHVLDDALNTAAKISDATDDLSKKMAEISPDDLTKISEIIPQEADALRIVNDISRIAAKYGLIMDSPNADKLNEWTADDLRGGVSNQANTNTGLLNGGAINAISLEFSVDSTYNTFISFIDDLEKSLRILDVVSVDFSVESSADQASEKKYTHKVKVITYALNNNPTP